MRLAPLLLAATLLTPLASAAPDLGVPGLGAPDADVTCDVLVVEKPARGLVCVVDMAFCVMAVVLLQDCAL